MCTKAVTVNVRGMSEKLNVPCVPPVTKTSNTNNLNGSDTLPTDLSPVITLNRPREIQFMRWGLIPHTTIDPKLVAPMFNARAETLLHLPSFKDLVMVSRCLILNEGFYEREEQGDEKVEWLIAPAQDDYFYKAGLWTTWRRNGEIIESFTMITCDPGNSAIGKIHDRTPIIMNKEQRRLWMNPNAPKEQVMALLQPCSDDMLRITEHSRKQLKAKKPPKKKDDDLGLFN